MKNLEKKNNQKSDASKDMNIDLFREKNREKQCQYRFNHTCQLVTSLLGWEDGMPTNICDKCWIVGENSPESKQIRKEYVASVVDTVKSFMKNSDYADIVLESMFKRHIKPKAAERYLISMCKKIGRKKSLKYANIIDKRIENA